MANERQRPIKISRRCKVRKQLKSDGLTFLFPLKRTRSLLPAAARTGNAVEFTCADRETRRIRLRHRVAGPAAGATTNRSANEKVMANAKTITHSYVGDATRGGQSTPATLSAINQRVAPAIASPRPPPPMPRSADIPVRSATKRNRFLGRKSSVKQIANATVAGCSPAIISHLQRAAARAQQRMSSGQSAAIENRVARAMHALRSRDSNGLISIRPCTSCCIFFHIFLSFIYVLRVAALASPPAARRESRDKELRCHFSRRPPQINSTASHSAKNAPHLPILGADRAESGGQVVQPSASGPDRRD